MTWIIGLTGLRTCGVIAGDIRVTTTAGHSFDGIQKVHLITASAAVGFAGSVRLGLRAVADMSQYARARFESLGVSDFRGGIEGWARRARHAWGRDVGHGYVAGLHLLVVTARRQPNAKEVEELLGVTFADASAYVLRAPGFAVEEVPWRRAVSIGSGRAYAQLTEQLTSIEDELEGLDHFELEPGFAPVGGAAAPLRVVLAEAIREVDPHDVSDHLHMCLVKPGASTIVTFNTAGLTPDAPLRMMPDEIATTEAEWDRIASRHCVADAVA